MHTVTPLHTPGPTAPLRLTHRNAPPYPGARKASYGCSSPQGEGRRVALEGGRRRGVGLRRPRSARRTVEHFLVDWALGLVRAAATGRAVEMPRGAPPIWDPAVLYADHRTGSRLRGAAARRTGMDERSDRTPALGDCPLLRVNRKCFCRTV